MTLFGRIDGILDGNTLLEIKSTKRHLDLLFVENMSHLAQLKLYAFMYMKNEGLETVKGTLTYISLTEYDTKSFDFVFDIDTLEIFFYESVNLYINWLMILVKHESKKVHSIKDMTFPFDHYRMGQRDFMKAVFHTVNDKKILYAIAPTGIGKTMASLFSSIKTLKEANEKIFYLTAKNEGKKIAIEAVRLLHEQGLTIKMLELTSKDMICFLEERTCDPNICPFAKGFFDRLKDAVIDIFENEDIMTRDVIEAYAYKHTVCPFEFSLSVSNYCDIIVCDYNYVFDPRAHLIRYFDEGNYKPILLIDEAHNLVSRSKDMFSATLEKQSLIDLRKHARTIKPSITHSVNKLIHHFENYEHEGFLEKEAPDKDLLDLTALVMKKIQKSLSQTPNHPKKSLILDGYYQLLQFDSIYGLYNGAYKTNVTVGEDVKITLQCLDASLFLKEVMMKKAYGTILFSATLYPLDYYKKLLSADVGESIMIKSPFDKNRLKVMTYDVNTRYKNRTDSLDDIIKSINIIASSKKGNYICFFPSYQYMQMLLEKLKPNADMTYLIQERQTDELSRREILDKLRRTSDKSQIAFFVLGGMFSEGIDYVGDMLNGVLVVGVGMPSFNDEQEQLRTYYEKKFDQGFHYAYTYPGMNKVIQAVGRVIRSSEDYGIAVLLDDRFNTAVYKSLMPKTWHPKEIQNIDTLEGVVKAFFDTYDK